MSEDALDEGGALDEEASGPDALLLAMADDEDPAPEPGALDDGPPPLRGPTTHRRPSHR